MDMALTGCRVVQIGPTVEYKIVQEDKFFPSRQVLSVTDSKFESPLGFLERMNYELFKEPASAGIRVRLCFVQIKRISEWKHYFRPNVLSYPN